jgi:hypothetical protein
MTVRDYITGKVHSLNLTLTDSDWSDIGKSVALDAEDTEANIRRAYTVLAKKVLPFYLRQAETVKENGFESSFNARSLLTFYKWLCGELGLEDVLSEKSSITDISDMW